MTEEQKQSLITIFNNGALDVAIEEVKAKLSRDLFLSEAHKVKERESIYHTSVALAEVKRLIALTVNK